MRTVEGKQAKPKPKQTAKPLADPDALVPGIPDHVKRPETDHPVQPVAVSANRSRNKPSEGSRPSSGDWDIEDDEVSN